jgi:hypothetical protein
VPDTEWPAATNPLPPWCLRGYPSKRAPVASGPHSGPSGAGVGHLQRPGHAAAQILVKAAQALFWRARSCWTAVGTRTGHGATSGYEIGFW